MKVYVIFGYCHISGSYEGVGVVDSADKADIKIAKLTEEKLSDYGDFYCDEYEVK